MLVFTPSRSVATASVETLALEGSNHTSPPNHPTMKLASLLASGLALASPQLTTALFLKHTENRPEWHRYFKDEWYVLLRAENCAAQLLMPCLQISKEDEKAGDEVEVRREDQDKINKFSRLHQRELAMEDELKTKNVRHRYPTTVVGHVH